MKKLGSLGKSLSKDQQRELMGGKIDPGGGGGGGGVCIGCYAGPGMYSCWYTNSGCGVCDRVYPGGSECFGAVGCGGCTLN